MNTNFQYPALLIDKNKVTHNTKELVSRCHKANINVAAVSKVFCAIPDMVEAMINGGAYMIADSRIENLVKIKHLNIPKLLLRLPSISRTDEVIEFADISLNSELDTLDALSYSAEKAGKTHKVIIMVDLGDLREGVWFENLIPFIETALALKGIKIIGIGTNLTCYGGVIPDENNLGLLVSLAKQIEDKFGIKLEIISGGNSSSLPMVFENRVPEGINQLRLGESIVLGLETAYGTRIEGLHYDAFTLALEVIEIKEKPSIPVGQIGQDAFGEKPTFIDKGIRKRGILAAGRQDINLSGLFPRDKDLSIIGGSSDHLIIDFTDSEYEYKPGDIVEFDVSYGGLLAAATSDYVKKYVI